MVAKASLLSLAAAAPLLLATIVQAAAAGDRLVRRQDEVELPGTPGHYSAPDYYNSHIGVDWNRTYDVYEPQQIHLSLGSESKFARVEFATLESVYKAIFKYWPKSKKHLVAISKGQDWTFVDGGSAKRPLYLHKIKSKTLKPATTYEYQVGTLSSKGLQWSSVYEFHTASRRKDFNFIATADIGINNAVALPHIIEAAKSHKYDFITVSGDQAYNMDDFNGTKGDEFLNLWQEVYARTPFMGVPGNHEAAYNYSHFKNRFDNLPYLESHFDNSLLYSFDYKSLHLISFSTELYFDGTPEMLQTGLNWLEADLQEANRHREQRPWIVLITHHPVYCSADSEDCTSKAALIRDGPLTADNKTHWGGLEELLLKYKVDVYLSGHVHNYERTYPVAQGKVASTSYHNAPSYMEVIVGNGGQPEQTVPFNTTGPFADWSAKRYDGYGFSLVNVSPKTFKMTHYEAKLDGSLGRVIDEFTLSKD